MDDQTVQTIVTLLGGGTVGAMLLELVRTWAKKASGRTSRERTRNSDLVAQRNTAVELAEAERDRATAEQRRADREARNRNLAQDYAADVRRVARDHGVPLDALPDPPRYHRPHPEE